jgi:DNA-binding CsgD family transcriptional regulator
LREEANAVATPSDAAALLALGRIALHTGDTRGAGTWASLAKAALDDATLELRRHVTWFLALRAFTAGDARGARAHLTPLEGDDWALPMLMVDNSDPVVLVRIARAAGDEHLVDVGVGVAEHRHSLNPAVSSLAATAAHARGLSSGDLTELAEACRLFDSGPRLLARASAHEDYGRELVGAGDRPAGIVELGQALELYSSAGATWDAARARSRLRAIGVRRRIPKPARPTSGWAGLTDAEVTVARLVADGLKNREVAERLFVSAHTVSMHLRHVFTKLDINSRVELARLVYLRDEAA